jgi:outer membrane lipoprotein-sorting protein
MHAPGTAQLLEDIAAAAVPDGIDLWPHLRCKVDSRARRHWTAERWALTAAAVAVLLMLSLGLLVTLTWPRTVSAETILDRATAPAGVQTYHLLMRHQSSANTAQTDVTEVWFDGSDRQRTTQRTSDTTGAVVSIQDVIFNGRDTWIVSTDAHGQTRAIHTVGTDWNKPAVAPTTQGDLTQLLERYGDRQCVALHLQTGSATVAGQRSYVLDVARKVDGCGVNPVASPVAVEARTTGQLQSSRLDRDMRHATVWVDQQTFLPLKTEVLDEGGAVVERSEVTSIAYNAAIDPGAFTYTPPAGVSVSTFTGGTGADVKRAMYATPEGEAPPAKP